MNHQKCMMVPFNINEVFAIRVYIIMCLGGHAPATLIFTVISEGVLIRERPREYFNGACARKRMS